MSKQSCLPEPIHSGRVPAPLAALCSATIGTPATILSVSTAYDDHAALRRSLAGLGCQIVTADTCLNALQLLRKGDISVVVCDSNLRDGTWRDILSGILTSSQNVTLVVTSPCPDEYLWAEVLNLGGFDVIAKPFDTQELRHVVETACRGALPHAARS